MQQQMTVTLIDKTAITVTSSVPQYVALEAKYDVAISDLQEKQKLTWLVFLAWHAATTDKLTELDLETFTAQVTDIDVKDVAAGEAPPSETAT